MRKSRESLRGCCEFTVYITRDFISFFSPLCVITLCASAMFNNENLRFYYYTTRSSYNTFIGYNALVTCAYREMMYLHARRDTRYKERGSSSCALVWSGVSALVSLSKMSSHARKEVCINSLVPFPPARPRERNSARYERKRLLLDPDRRW